jgi:hypothetical protein
VARSVGPLATFVDADFDELAATNLTLQLKALGVAVRVELLASSMSVAVAR